MGKTKRLGIGTIEKTSKKEDWKCPNCRLELAKKKETGEGIKHCVSCGFGWFILNTSRPKESREECIDFQI
jgi:ribosomal protein L37AE/L43A